MTKIYGFEPVVHKPHPRGGHQLMYRFPNGYGASVIPGHYDDERELAVIRWDPNVRDGFEFVNGTDVTRGDFAARRICVEYICQTLAEIATYTPELVEQMARRNSPRNYEED